MTAGKSPWDDRTVRMLRGLVQTMTGSEIARALGMTRSQVIGKATRLGLVLPGRTHPQTKAKERPRARLNGVTLADMRDDACMYLNDDGTYCGRKVAVARSSWCEEHRKLVLRGGNLEAGAQRRKP